MTQLYRACYLRDGFPRGVTFSAADTDEAVEFSAFWEKTTKCPVLTLKEIGQSKIKEQKQLRLTA